MIKRILAVSYIVGYFLIAELTLYGMVHGWVISGFWLTNLFLFLMFGLLGWIATLSSVIVYWKDWGEK